jgi:hypothetical protein
MEFMQPRMFGHAPFGAGTNNHYEAVPEFLYTGYGPPIESRGIIASEIENRIDDWGRINADCLGEAAFYGVSASPVAPMPTVPDNQTMIEKLSRYLFDLARGQMETQNAGNEICGQPTEDQTRMFRDIIRGSL